MPIDDTRALRELERLALRQDWPLPPAVKRRVLQTLCDILDDETELGQFASRREKTAAARALLAAGALSLQQQALDLRQPTGEVPSAADAVDRMESAAARYLEAHPLADPDPDPRAD